MVMDARNDLFYLFTYYKGRGEIDKNHEFCFGREILNRVHNIFFCVTIELLFIKRELDQRN